MNMKIAVFYYSQSGQALKAARNICKPLEKSGDRSGDDVRVVYKEIVTQRQYPFPWSKDEFFDVFPETRLGIPLSGIEPMDFSDINDADLVLVVGQSWFLSPSQPLQAFFSDEAIKDYLKGRPVVFVNACRNMWLMTTGRIKQYVKDAQARLVGHIVLQDKTMNLVSVVTIIRWLVYGKKNATAVLPQAGISDKDLEEASRFGEVVMESLQKKDLDGMQDRLLDIGAIDYKPSVLFLEKIGHKMFGLWAKFIRKKGDVGDRRRRFRVNLFYIYLMTVLFVLSPFAQLFFNLTYPLRHVSRNKWNDCHL